MIVESYVPPEPSTTASRVGVSVLPTSGAFSFSGGRPVLSLGPGSDPVPVRVLGRRPKQKSYLTRVSVVGDSWVELASPGKGGRTRSGRLGTSSGLREGSPPSRVRHLSPTQSMDVDGII